MSNDARWNKIAADMLVGQVVSSVRYMTPKEASDSGFASRPVVIEFGSGLHIFPMRDDEGNDAGALATSDRKNSCLPVL
jgi:hypothetical protein